MLIFRTVHDDASDTYDVDGQDVVNIMFGGIFFLLAVSVHWFNEDESAELMRNQPLSPTLSSTVVNLGTQNPILVMRLIQPLKAT